MLSKTNEEQSGTKQSEKPKQLHISKSKPPSPHLQCWILAYIGVRGPRKVQ